MRQALRSKKASPPTRKIRLFSDGYWTFLINPGSNVSDSEITGKYLFFSKDREALLGLGKLLLAMYKLPQAKTQNPEKRISQDYVLCVYDREPRLKLELRKYADEIHIQYRYWKSEAETRSGKYSPQFLQGLADKR
jgi:hypothetical protein